MLFDLVLNIVNVCIEQMVRFLSNILLFENYRDKNIAIEYSNYNVSSRPNNWRLDGCCRSLSGQDRVIRMFLIIIRTWVVRFSSDFSEAGKERKGIGRVFRLLCCMFIRVGKVWIRVKKLKFPVYSMHSSNIFYVLSCTLVSCI